MTGTSIEQEFGCQYFILYHPARTMVLFTEMGQDSALLDLYSRLWPGPRPVNMTSAFLPLVMHEA